MALIAHTVAASANANTVTSSAIDTTGADLIVVALALYDSTTPITDSEGNTWTALGGIGIGFFGSLEYRYCLNPTTSDTHTFSCTPVPTGKKPSIAVSAWSGANAYSDDGFRASSTNTTMSTDPLTPGAIGWLLLSAVSVENTDTLAVASPFTALGQVGFDTSFNAGLSHAYAFAASTSPVDADWSWATSTPTRSSVILLFDYTEPPIPKIGCFVLGGTENGASNVSTSNTGYIALDNVARTVSGEGVQFIGGANGFIEQASAPTGIANTAMLYAEDNGSGKTRLVVKFGTGSAIVIATEV
jgi:hypothetical protein